MHERTKPQVIVALSGGVDSAVAALLLLRSGYHVSALHMTNWEEADGYCTAQQDLADARRVSAELDITLHHANFAAEYRARVFAGFLDGYAGHATPNPDVACNRYIKFGAFLEHARRLGADLIATGHYARRGPGPEPSLRRALDAEKDQTYFLHAIEPGALAVTLFPLGELHKSEVRTLAREAGLPIHAKRDSTGICFIGERPFSTFLGRYLPAEPGPIRTPEGIVLGQHRGLGFYTLGQRQGLGIGGHAGGTGGAWYVAGKDPRTNALVVVQDRQHPLLWRAGLRTRQVRWLPAEPAALAREEPLACTARVRHRQPDTACVVTRSEAGGYDVRFARPQWAVTPGQHVVFYAGDTCLGGGVITSTEAGRDPVALSHAASA